MSEKKTILVVEDEPNLRELVKARLEQSGYEVVTAADGFNAIVQARKVKPDLIILDLMIPKMDGYTVCRTIKSTADLNRIPIIMFTARTSPDDVRRGKDMGADAYITKPFNPETLLGKIQELLAPPSAPPGPAPSAPVPPPTKGEQHRIEREAAEKQSREEAQARTQAMLDQQRRETIEGQQDKGQPDETV
ncbi:MAG: response regulator transcription factor [candidate division WOR-3 bacterium]|jgi:DNA-binding response OmpR family regulator